MRRLVDALAHALWTAAIAAGDRDLDGAASFEDVRERRSRLSQAVAEVMQQGPARWDEVMKRSVTSCARQRAETVLAAAGGEHPAVYALVSAALRDPTDAPNELHRAVGAHAPDCEVCSEILRTVRAMDHAGQKWEPPESIVAEDDVTDPGVSRTPPKRVRKPRPPRRAEKVEKVKRRSRAAWWPVVAIWAGVVWWKWGPDQPVEETQDQRYALLADRSPPEVPPASALPAQASDVRRDVEMGDCFTAAARGRGIRLNHPDNLELSLLIGASLVCAGDGRKAEEVLVPLIGKVPGGQVSWLIAQAHLLQGHPDQATNMLHQVSRIDTRLRPRAEAQLLQLASARTSETLGVQGP
jgi:hypothetical protein